MDRNLGATTVTTNTVSTLGLLYQWGRKDPFPGSASTTDDDEEPTIYNASGTSSTTMITKTEVSAATNLDNAIKNPLTFYCKSSSSDYDWYSSSGTHNDALWGGADISSPTVKTMFDPSPAGWRVPTWKGLASPWSKFTTGTFSWNATYLGCTYTDGAFYPAAGYRSIYSGALYQAGNSGFYWSGSPNDSKGYNLYFYGGDVFSGGVYPESSDRRASGYSVRCVQDK